ncbi:MAG: glycosyltransferase family 4 protein [Candidatus Omnitrophota bacterium]|nr:glycosyltransferase family 4 protein [Candidatus Omnitrophota bacterium]
MIFSIYSPNYQADGIGDYTRILVQKLRQRGHDVHVIASGRYAGDDQRVIKIGDGYWGIRELVKAFRKIREGRFDVVHLQYTPVSYGFGVTFKFLPFLIQISIHDILFVTTFHTLVGGKWISRLNALLLSAFSHKIIGTNEEVAFLFRKWLGLFKGKFSQIPIGANVSPAETDIRQTRELLAKKYGIVKDAVILSNFGFSNPGKGFEDLIDALNRLNVNGRYYVLQIGAIRDEDVEFRNYLKSLIRMRGMEKNFIWTGKLDQQQASALLKASDIYVVPYTDGISIRRGSLMAGIVNGLPIISTFPRVEVPYFKDGKNVVLVERGDPVRLAGAVERLAKDKDLREKLSVGVNELAEEFDWDRIADRTLKVYSRGK